MDTVMNLVELMGVASTMLLLLLTSNTTLDFRIQDDANDDNEKYLDDICNIDNAPLVDIDLVTQVALHYFRLCNVFSLFDTKFSFPGSTTWFSRFIFDQYNETRWLKIF